MLVTIRTELDDQYEYTFMTWDLTSEPSDSIKYAVINELTRFKFSSYNIVTEYGELEYMIFNDQEIRAKYKKRFSNRSA